MYKQLLGNDLVVNEDHCNLSCEYCLTGQSNLKQGHRDQLIFQTPQRDEYSVESPLGKRLRAVTERIDARFATPFLKVTGGEIFLVKGMMDFLRWAADRHEVLVVQTNGVLLRTEYLEEFKRWGNVVVQVSLDSHLFSGNSYRVSREDLHHKIVKRLTSVFESGLPVEVYSVLNDRSVLEMETFAEWLMRFESRPVYMPFPIRGPDANRFKIRPEQVEIVRRFVATMERFMPILPPRAYFRRLMRFFDEGERRFGCHLPRLVLSSFSDGVLTACPNIWFSDMGNLLGEDWSEVTDKVGSTGMYQALLAPTPRLDACKGCFTPWDLLSMYFDDEITLDELCASPTYSRPSIRSLLAATKGKAAPRQAESLAVA